LTKNIKIEMCTRKKNRKSERTYLARKKSLQNEIFGGGNVNQTYRCEIIKSKAHVEKTNAMILLSRERCEIVV
jgi:hypothetical protein